MTKTYKFYDKAEDERYCDIMTFDGTEQEIDDAVHEYCDIYGYEAFTEIPTKKVWTEDEIRRLVQSNDKVLYGALKKLYAEQTADEKQMEATKVRNNAGFNALDAKFLSSISEFLIHKGFLTDKQKVATRRKLVKYTRQLTRLANA